MTVIGPANTLALEAELRCEECGENTHALVAGQLDQRSLRSLALSAEKLAGPDNEELKCQCGGVYRLVEMRYHFDEAGLPELVYQADDGLLRVGGVEVSSESDLHELIGRPFSVADFHRQMLSAEMPGSYMPSPGLVVLAVSGQAVEGLVQEIISEAGEEEPDFDLSEISGVAKDCMDEGVELLAGSDFSHGMVGPLAWTRFSGWRSWLGEPGERIDEGELICASVLVASEIINELRHHGGKLDMALEEEGGEEGKTLTFSALEQHFDIDINQIAMLTVEHALTISEAAAWVAISAHHSLECCYEVIKELRQEGWLISSEPDGRIRVAAADNSGVTGLMNLISIARKSNHEPKDMMEQIRQLLAQMSEVGDPDHHKIGGERQCGCTPTLSFVVRGEEWLAGRDEAYGKEYVALSKEAWGGARKALVEDCEHSLSYVTALISEQDSPENLELLEQGEQGLSRANFTVYGKAFKSADNKTHAVLWAGHNVNTVLLDEGLSRGLDRQLPRVDKAVEEITVVSLTSDLVMLLDPEVESSLLDIQISAALREMGYDSPWDRSNPIPYTRQLARAGERAGKFKSFKLQ
jgi:hypothetical protein